jgi:hypothetical protein
MFVKIGVGIARTGTEGRFLTKGHENRQCINDSDTGETEQHRAELCKEWI